MSVNDSFPLIDEENSTLFMPISSDEENNKPPLDPRDFDYVYFIADLSNVREQWSEDQAFLPATITYGLAFVFGVVGNAFVILALLGTPHVGRGAEGMSSRSDPRSNWKQTAFSLMVIYSRFHGLKSPESKMKYAANKKLFLPVISLIPYTF